MRHTCKGKNYGLRTHTWILNTIYKYMWNLIQYNFACTNESAIFQLKIYNQVQNTRLYNRILFLYSAETTQRYEKLELEYFS